MKLNSMTTSLVAFFAAGSLGLASALLVQPYNYMLDDTAMVSNSQQQDGGSLSPFYNDQAGSAEHNADKDIIEIIGERLARMRLAKMLEADAADASGAPSRAHLSQEMAELMEEQQKTANNEQGNNQQQDSSSLGSSVANMLMNVAQAAAQASGSPDEPTNSQPEQSSVGATSGGVSHDSQISELDTTNSAGSSGSSSAPSKADLKGTQSHWFNPKETIPVLKISSMATPSKYKKVYFRSEKKLVDGAFHSLGAEQDSTSAPGSKKKSLIKPFSSSGAQRRSSRGTTASAAPPSILQDGVIDFLKKFRDVYIQTRPTSGSSGSSGSAGSSFASSMVAAASAPFVSVLAPSSAGSRPNFASALSAASSMVNSAMIAQAANTGSGSSSSSLLSSSSSSSSPTSSSALSAPGSSGATSSGTTGGNSNKSPISAQTYVSFWSKTFPTWVRKMLKQLRRRSLYNSSKRHQQQQHHAHQHGSSLGQAAQAAASGAVASVVGDSSSTGSSGSSSSSH